MASDAEHLFSFSSHCQQPDFSPFIQIKLLEMESNWIIPCVCMLSRILLGVSLFLANLLASGCLEGHFSAEFWLHLYHVTNSSPVSCGLGGRFLWEQN